MSKDSKLSEIKSQLILEKHSNQPMFIIAAVVMKVMMVAVALGGGVWQGYMGLLLGGILNGKVPSAHRCSYHGSLL